MAYHRNISDKMAIEALQNVMAQLHEVADPSAESLKIINELASDVYGFGLYDANTQKDYELAKMIWPKIQRLKQLFHLEEGSVEAAKEPVNKVGMDFIDPADKKE